MEFFLTIFFLGALGAFLLVDMVAGMRLGQVIPLFVFLCLTLFIVEKGDLQQIMRAQVYVELYNDLAQDYLCIAKNTSTAYFCSYCDRSVAIYQTHEQRIDYCKQSYDMCVDKTNGVLK